MDECIYRSGKARLLKPFTFVISRPLQYLELENVFKVRTLEQVVAIQNNNPVAVHVLQASIASVSQAL